MSPEDQWFAELAAAQAGVASIGQARLLGFTEGQIAHRRASGRWPLARNGVVRLPGAPVTWESDLIAAWLVLGSRAVISHRTAAALHRFDGFDGGPIELTAVRAERHPPLATILHSTRQLDPIDVVPYRRALGKSVRASRVLRRARLVTTLRVTSASRTVIDLAGAATTAGELGAAIDSACRSGLSSASFLIRRQAALRRPGRRGPRRLDEVMLDSGGHSYLERRFLRLLRECGLPRPRCQVVWKRGGHFVARVDFDFQPWPLVVEVNGRRGHSSDADRAKDARRRNELQFAGVTVVEFTTSDVIGSPAVVVRTIRELADARGWSLIPRSGRRDR